MKKSNFVKESFFCTEFYSAYENDAYFDLLICKIGKIMLDINREITANIGIVIRRLRREKGITQKQLSSELGISVAYINLIENNRIYQKINRFNRKSIELIENQQNFIPNQQNLIDCLLKSLGFYRFLNDNL